MVTFTKSQAARRDMNIFSGFMSRALELAAVGRSALGLVFGQASAELNAPTPRAIAPVAQLDRAPDYESGGQEFESLRARHLSFPGGSAADWPVIRGVNTFMIRLNTRQTRPIVIIAATAQRVPCSSLE